MSCIKGYSLIELLLALSIAGMIMAFAIPSWEQAVMKSRRNEAITTLNHIAAQQELFRIHHRRYALGTELHKPQIIGLGIPDGTHYEITLETIDDGYFATAKVRAGGAQQQDKYCWIFRIDAHGQRSANHLDGSESTEGCWRK